MFRFIKSTFFPLVGFTLLFFSAHTAFAQSIPGIAEPVSFQVSPQFPKPGSTVNVTAQSFSTDLNRATFTWNVNGKLFKQGAGITKISVPAGKAGMLTSVSVSVVTVDIGTISNSVSFRPADVSLLWRSDGYVPPFYKGKALEAYGGGWSVTALPEFISTAGKRMDPKTLVYTWKKNGTVDASQSGYGKDTFTGTQTSYVRGGDDITVDVSDVAQNIGANSTITISPTTPEIVFYENSPLYGIVYEKSIHDQFNLSAEEITLQTVPYGISAADPLSGSLTFDWKINNEGIPDFKDKDKITLRKSGAGGQSSVSVSIQHKSRVLQGGQASITILQ